MLEENLDFKNNFYLINKCSPQKKLLLQNKCEPEKLIYP